MMTIVKRCRSKILGGFAIAAGMFGCSDDKAAEVKFDVTASEHPLVIVTETQTMESSFHYLSIVNDWPSDGKLDMSKALELGTGGLTHVLDQSIFFYHPEEGTFTKFALQSDGSLSRSAPMSFMRYGISGNDPEPIWASSDLAFMVDEKSGQIARWNPSTLKVEQVDPIDPDLRMRDGLNLQFQLGFVAANRVFTSANWRNWDTNEVHQAVAVGIFDEESPANGPKIVEDDRCAASVSVGPWLDDDDTLYAVGDGAQGFDVAGNPKKTPNPQCVVRMKDNADAFDKDFFIDLQKVTGSPVIYFVYPMDDPHKILVNMWSPDVDINDVADPDMPGWWWELHDDFEYTIVDMDKGTSQRIEDLPRGAIQSQKSLMVDGVNYVQRFRDDRGSTLHRIDADGHSTQVLDNPSGVNVQYIGRL
jgi:hypothetical protein